MPSSSITWFSDHTLNTIVQQTFKLLLECDTLPYPQLDCRNDDLSLAVYCDKQQQSAVIVRCSRILATALTSRLLEMPKDEVQEADRLDAVGEVVNVIAGSLRGLMPFIGKMSTPFRVSPADHDLVVSGSRSADYLIQSEPFHLYTILNHVEDIA